MRWAIFWRRFGDCVLALVMFLRFDVVFGFFFVVLVVLFSWRFGWCLAGALVWVMFWVVSWWCFCGVWGCVLEEVVVVVVFWLCFGVFE